MIIPNFPELELVDVKNRGEANREYIVIKVIHPVNLAQFCVLAGFKSPQEGFVPFGDYMFWFGEGVVNAGDWIFLFTGSGNPSSQLSPDGAVNYYSCYWGKPRTIFANSNVVPALAKIGSIDILKTAQDQPQYKQLERDL